MGWPGWSLVPNIVNTVVFSPGSVIRPNILFSMSMSLYMFGTVGKIEFDHIVCLSVHVTLYKCSLKGQTNFVLFNCN